MSSFLLLATLNISCFFIFMVHPLAMGLMLLIQTCLISFLTGTMSVTFWFSYILFLVFLGGMLVLFIYMTSLASNEMFSLSSPMLASTPLSFLLFLFTIPFVYFFNWAMPHFPEFPSLSSTISEPSLTTLLLKLYSTLTSHLTILLACYLFLTLIIVVNLISVNQGPLRTYKI